MYLGRFMLSKTGMLWQQCNYFFFFSLLQYLKNKLESFNLVCGHSVRFLGGYMYPFTDEFTGTSIIIKKKLIFIQEKFVATLLQACDILKKKNQSIKNIRATKLNGSTVIVIKFTNILCCNLCFSLCSSLPLL